MNDVHIRQYEQDDLPLLGELYRAVTANEHAVFWWIGEAENWVNVYCAFVDGRMIAKGQVSIINVIPPDRSPNNRHEIYMNLKTLPEYERDHTLLDNIYKYLLERAWRLKDDLPASYETILCVGNDASERANLAYFQHKRFLPLKNVYGMSRSLSDTIPNLLLPSEFTYAEWKMDTLQEEYEYLQIEGEIWPDSPLGHERLTAYKANKGWTSMIIRHQQEIAGGLMIWEEGGCGTIEDVFVRPEWRKCGLAKHLLAQALCCLQDRGLPYARLMVATDNDSALSLYETLGFRVDQQEVRYYIDLKK